MASSKRHIDVDGEASKQDVQAIQDCLNILFDFFELDKVEVSIRLGDSTEVQNLNNLYRGFDKPTDVLSFPSPEGIESLGDVIICVPIAEKQANIHGHALINEICYLCVHGVLHLLGYNDEEENDYIEMNNILQKIIERSQMPVHITWHSLPSNILEKGF